jgi:hypothetical protein
MKKKSVSNSSVHPNRFLQAFTICIATTCVWLMRPEAAKAGGAQCSNEGSCAGTYMGSFFACSSPNGAGNDGCCQFTFYTYSNPSCTEKVLNSFNTSKRCGSNGLCYYPTGGGE